MAMQNNRGGLDSSLALAALKRIEDAYSRGYDSDSLKMSRSKVALWGIQTLDPGIMSLTPE